LGQSAGLPSGPFAHGTVEPVASVGTILAAAVVERTPGLGAGDGIAWAVVKPATRMPLAMSATRVDLAFIDRSFPGRAVRESMLCLELAGDLSNEWQCCQEDLGAAANAVAARSRASTAPSSTRRRRGPYRVAVP
jgi:hypothetical protein